MHEQPSGAKRCSCDAYPTLFGALTAASVLVCCSVSLGDASKAQRIPACEQQTEKHLWSTSPNLYSSIALKMGLA